MTYTLSNTKLLHLTSLLSSSPYALPFHVSPSCTSEWTIRRTADIGKSSVGDESRNASACISAKQLYGCSQARSSEQAASDFEDDCFVVLMATVSQMMGFCITYFLLRFSSKDLSHLGQLQSHFPCSLYSLFFKRITASSSNCRLLVSEPELVSVEVLTGMELESGEIASTCCWVPSLPKPSKRCVSRMESLVWLYAEPAPYRVAVVLGESESDVFPGYISCEGSERSWTGKEGGRSERSNSNWGDWISFGCGPIPIIGSEKLKSSMGKSPSVAISNMPSWSAKEPREAASCVKEFKWSHGSTSWADVIANEAPNSGPEARYKDATSVQRPVE